MIAGRKRQTLAQARHFSPLGLGEILTVIGKQRAGVEELVVKKAGVKVVAQIVMGGDILLRLRARVAARPVAQSFYGLAQ